MERGWGHNASSMCFFLWTLISLPLLVIVQFTLIKPWNKSRQTYSASVTGVPSLNSFTSRATIIHPSGHVFQSSAIEGHGLTWAARVGWKSKKLLFRATTHRHLKAVLSPLRICDFFISVPLGRESRSGQQKGRMSPHSFSLLWA